MSQDLVYMARAIELARLGRFTTAPNPNVGCVIVRNGQIVGEGYHHKAGEPHAEVHALRMAGAAAKDSTAYVTLEPCSHYGRTPPCADALISAGVARVVVAMQDPNPKVAGQGLARLRAAGIETEFGVLEQQAEALNRGFLKRMRTGLPYVTLKLAASLDGRTAMASGESKWITSPGSRQDVQGFRAESAAILSTGATVVADDPELTVRWPTLAPEIREVYPESQLRQPLRVIIDSQSRVTPQHKLIGQPGNTLLVGRCQDRQPWPDNVAQILTVDEKRSVDLPLLMQALGQQQINSIWTEAGANLAGALIQARLVDELIIYIAPKLLGDSARGLCHLPGLSLLADVPQFDIIDVQQIGSDIRLRLIPLG